MYVELGVEVLSTEQMRDMGKFHNPDRTRILIRHFKDAIAFVGLNSFDATNPDLGISATSEVQLDAYGDAVLPFVPYPTTPWGDRALGIYALGESWNDVATLHSLYSILSGKGAVATALRRSLTLRKSAMHALSLLRSVSNGLTAMSTRHERLADNRTDRDHRL